MHPTTHRWRRCPPRPPTSPASLSMKASPAARQVPVGRPMSTVILARPFTSSPSTMLTRFTTRSPARASLRSPRLRCGVPRAQAPFATRIIKVIRWFCTMHSPIAGSLPTSLSNLTPVAAQSRRFISVLRCPRPAIRSPVAGICMPSKWIPVAPANRLPARSMTMANSVYGPTACTWVRTDSTRPPTITRAQSLRRSANPICMPVRR